MEEQPVQRADPKQDHVCLPSKQFVTVLNDFLTDFVGDVFKLHAPKYFMSQPLFQPRVTMFFPIVFVSNAKLNRRKGSVVWHINTVVDFSIKCLEFLNTK